jgi:DNA-binding XRE family transcriptional regulator
MRSAGGMIYAISAVGESYVKVGSTSQSVARRLRQLQTGHPYPLEMLAAVPVEQDRYVIERQVQQFLAQERGHLTAEWFDGRLDEKELADLVLRAIAYVDMQRKAQRARKIPRVHVRAPSLFGIRLRQRREQHGWSALCLADKAHVVYETVYRAEKGTHGAPRLDVVIKLAQALGVSIDYLAGLTDNPRPRSRRAQETVDSVS